MCPPVPAAAGGKDQRKTATLKSLVGLLSLSTVGLLASTLALAMRGGSGGGSSYEDNKYGKKGSASPLETIWEKSVFSSFTDNSCAGASLALDNALCADLEVAPQAGANVTKGYLGKQDVGDILPNAKPYYQSGMCPVNVHWHLGAEHYSWGEYDEGGDGPHGNQARPDWAKRERDLAAGKVRDGFRCHHYDKTDSKFTTPYSWEHCVGMVVGETYEVHWPHSAAGACGTVDQYQSPFSDGIFCNLDQEGFEGLLAASGPQGIALAVGVQGQVFTIVNDESYFYPDMMRGMMIDPKRGMGQDVAYYTGSTTGTSRDNEMCSAYTPITWQVDRRCHMISASSFDKMCHDMKLQRDDMSGDLRAHGSRELVRDDLVANNLDKFASDPTLAEDGGEGDSDGSGRSLRA